MDGQQRPFEVVFSSDADFRQMVAASLGRLEANMAVLVGADGGGGRMKEMRDDIGELGERTTSLETSRTRSRTRMGIIITILNLAWGAIIAAFSYFQRR